jgi:predicted GIY-YIG superfamily endonuclease
VGKGKRVYVIENQKGEVKIGVSNNVEVRIKAIQNQTGYKIVSTYFTDICFNPFDVEKEIQNAFEEQKVFGEWFLVSFKNAVKETKEAFRRKALLEALKTSRPYIDLFEYFHGKLE